MRFCSYIIHKHFFVFNVMYLILTLSWQMRLTLNFWLVHTCKWQFYNCQQYITKAAYFSHTATSSVPILPIRKLSHTLQQPAELVQRGS